MNSKIKKGNLFYKEFLLFALFSGFLCLCFYLVGRLFIRSAAEENAQYQQSAIKTYISFIDSKRSIELRKQAIIGYLPPEGVAVSDQDLLTYIERTARETDEELIFYDVLSSRTSRRNFSKRCTEDCLMQERQVFLIIFSETLPEY